MNVKDLKQVIDRNMGDPDLEIAVRIHDQVYSIETVEMVNVDGEPWFLALDCTAKEVGEDDDDPKEEGETTG